MNFKSLKRFSEKVKVTKPVEIDYYNLLKPNKGLMDKLESAIGSKALGAFLIKNMPKEYIQSKNLLYQKAFILGNLKEEYLNNLSSKNSKVKLGWNYANHNPFYDNKSEVDLMYGLYMARTLTEKLVFPENPDLENLYSNIWPDVSKPEYKDLKNYKEYYQNLGIEINKIHKLILPHLDEFVNFKVPRFEKGTFTKFTENHDPHAVLNICFPTEKYPTLPEASKKSWINWHTDSCILTGVVPAIYVDSYGNRLDYNNPCFKIKDRNDKVHDIQYEENDLLIQTGDYSFVFSGGEILSVPHGVMLNENVPKNAFRFTFAQFFNPDMK